MAIKKINCKEYKFMMFSNESDEAFLFKTEMEARKEALNWYKNCEGIKEVYLAPITNVKTLQFKLIEK